MSERGTKLLEEALSLSPAERVDLVERLLASLDASPNPQIDQLWAQEAEDRLDAFERGEIRAVSAKEAFDTARHVKR
jgi:putative addiction module component (TIGR02574 family)